MTRIPSLEAELIAAGRRRYGRSRQIPRIRLAPAAAFVAIGLMVVVGFWGGFRVGEPEEDVGTNRPASPAAAAVAPGPIANALQPGGPAPRAAGGALQAIRVSDSAGAGWLVAAYERGDADWRMGCTAAAADGQTDELPVDISCTSVGTMAETLDEAGVIRGQFRGAQGPDEGSRIASGFVRADATSVRVTVNGVSKPAVLTPDPVLLRMGEKERAERAARNQPVHDVKAKAFATAFTEAEVPGDLARTTAEIQINFPDGTQTSGALGYLERDTSLDPDDHPLTLPGRLSVLIDRDDPRATHERLTAAGYSVEYELIDSSAPDTRLARPPAGTAILSVLTKNGALLTTADVEHLLIELVGRPSE